MMISRHSFEENTHNTEEKGTAHVQPLIGDNTLIRKSRSYSGSERSVSSRAR